MMRSGLASLRCSPRRDPAAAVTAYLRCAMRDALIPPVRGRAWTRRPGCGPVHQASFGAFGQRLGRSANRVTLILNGQRGVSADTALRLARYFGTTPQFWVNLQKTWELRRAEIVSGHEIAERVAPRPSAGAAPEQQHESSGNGSPAAVLANRVNQD